MSLSAADDLICSFQFGNLYWVSNGNIDEIQNLAKASMKSMNIKLIEKVWPFFVMTFWSFESQCRFDENNIFMCLKFLLTDLCTFIHMPNLCKSFLPEASFGLRVLSLPASVCLCVCLPVCVRQPWACPCHKSSRVQARTIKFGQKVQKVLVKVPIVLGGDWPWPSRSNLTWKAKFTPFWACPRHNSPHIQARTIKFGQKM